MAGTPPAVAPRSMRRFLDEAVLGELTQVIAGRAAIQTEPHCQLRRGGGSIDPEHAEHAQPDRMRQRLQRSGIGHDAAEGAGCGDGLSRLRARIFHAGSLLLQRYLCKSFFA